MANRRRVRMDKFKAQIADQVIGEDSLVELETGKGEYVTIYIPIDPEEAEAHGKQLQASGADTEAGALVIFSHNPDVSAEDQLAQWKAAGLTMKDLLLAYQAETVDARERLGKFRYRG